MKKIALILLICFTALYVAGCGGGAKRANLELQTQVEELSQENEILKEKVAELIQENESLLQQVTAYQKTEELEVKREELAREKQLLEQEIVRLKRQIK